jgi:chloride channel 2
MSRFVTTINRLYAVRFYRDYIILNDVIVKSLQNEAHNNELLAAACAVGVSSNFGAPIGGVLFSIEVTSTYFAVRNYWRGFFGAVCGAFLFRLAAVWFKDEETITALFKTSFRPDFPFDLQELSAFALIGVLAGLVGVAFVWFHKQYVHARRKLRSYTRLLEKHVFIYPAIVTILFTSLTFPLGLGKFMAGELTQHAAINHLFSNVTWSTLPPPHEAFQDLPEDSDEYQIVRQWGQPNIFVTLLLFSALRFVFTAIAVSLPIPSGVFFPVFVLGAALGRLVGEAMATAFPNGVNGSIVSPGGYAVVGAAALAGSVTHTISTSVIVFELTGQITHILPVMIAVLISNAISSALQPSIYDSIILLKQLSYLPDLKPNKYYNLYATDIMQMDLAYVSYRSTYGELQTLLRTTHHPSYPLVDAPDSRILIGSVSRHNLAALLEDHLTGLYKHAQQIRGTHDADEIDGKSGRSTPDSAADVMKRRISSVPHSLAKIFGSSDEPDFPEVDGRIEWSSDQEGPKQALDELREELLSQTIDFKKSYIDPAPFQLVERTSLYKIHSLFSILCLSHAYVTSIGRLVGVVTLKDLREAIEGKLKPIEERSRSATLVEISSTL